MVPLAVNQRSGPTFLTLLEPDLVDLMADMHIMFAPVRAPGYEPFQLAGEGEKYKGCTTQA